MSNFKFSIVVAIYNSAEYLEEAIESVIDQSIGFKKNVQLILVNDGSTDNSMDIINRYYNEYPDNIVPLSKENGGQASARNLGLKYATGEIVNFLDGDDMLEFNALSVVYEFFRLHEDIDMASIPIMYFDKYEGNHYLNCKYKEERVIDLKEEYMYPQLSSSSSFIKREAISNHFCNDTLKKGEDIVLINEILLEKQKIGLISSTEYKYRKLLDSLLFRDNPFSSKKGFTEYIESCYKHLIDYSIRKYTYVPKFIQYLIALDLNEMVNAEEFDLIIKEKDELAEFWDSFNYIIKYIDDDVIKGHKNISKKIKRLYMYLKHKDVDIQCSKKKDRVFFKSGGYLIDRVEWHKLFIDIIEIKGDVLNISGFFSSNFFIESVNIEAIIKQANGEKEILECKKVQYPTTARKTKRHLGIDWQFYNNFDLEIPLEKYDDFKVSFRYVFNEGDKHAISYPEIKFRDYANLTAFSNYFVNGSKMVLYRDNALHVINYTTKFRIKMELKSLLNIFFASERSQGEAFYIRLIYYLLYKSYSKKRIWLFMDRPAVADDNAEHLFKYAIGQNDDIEKYFVIDKKSDDFKRMSKISKNVIKYKSIKHKILYLFSEKSISSHADDFWINPFYDSNMKLFCGLTTIEKCFLQHGVIKDDLSYWIRKYHKNLFLFLTSSDYERDSIVNGYYNYSEEVVQALGLPRFDNLTNESNKKEILFIPTWRNYIYDEEDFIYSEYGKNLNSVLNNKKLLDLLKNKGYKLIFKPHYNLLPFIDLLDIPEEIILSEESFPKLLNNSSILISDYSSVCFDFAYIKKPIIYYQRDDYHYDSNYFDYETMAFGNVTKSEEELVEMIRKIIESNCEMEEKYKNRVDKFFKYTDKNNCKRVYDWLKKNK